MEDVEFSDEFCRFIQLAIPAVDAAELLLVFHRKPEAALNAQEAVAKLGPGIARGDAEKYLSVFVANGLLEPVDGRFRYRLENAAAAHVETLSQAYLQRPVTLIRVIYALRDSRIQTFADAFKLRKG
jgi:DNA-binding IclR family transcriptional regulator